MSPAIEDCALLRTLHRSPFIHSILVRSGLFSHTTRDVLELVFYIRISPAIFFFIFSNVFIYLKGWTDERIEEENGRDLEGKEHERKSILFSNKSTLEKVVMRL